MENFRCFRKPQSARLAPLTLLVGENSTGKTSFLALVRALWTLAFHDSVPDFREEPYDLGTFSDTVHNRGGRSKQPADFAAGFEARPNRPLFDSDKYAFKVVFKRRGAFPVPFRRRLEGGGTWIEVETEGNGKHSVNFGTPDISKCSFEERRYSLGDADLNLIPIPSVLFRIGELSRGEQPRSFQAGITDDSPDSAFNVSVGRDDLNKLYKLNGDLEIRSRRGIPYASAPVRSIPRRTYDPTRPRRDPEEGYIPTYLAGISHSNPKTWEALKTELEKFGQQAGLFDEISIKSFGDAEGAPFQVQIRKFSGSGKSRQAKGPWRNLIDVGYGVSQVLPLLTELLNPEPAPLFLLQQPEVHLHPSVQAALGSLFCSVAGPERQLIVETHSDYLLDRVRMDVRDKKTDLKPEDVSILYFERDGLEVNIHSLRLDEMGNVLDAPPGYGQFFMDEVTRSIGL